MYTYKATIIMHKFYMYECDLIIQVKHQTFIVLPHVYRRSGNFRWTLFSRFKFNFRHLASIYIVGIILSHLIFAT